MIAPAYRCTLCRAVFDTQEEVDRHVAYAAQVEARDRARYAHLHVGDRFPVVMRPWFRRSRDERVLTGRVVVTVEQIAMRALGEGSGVHALHVRVTPPVPTVGRDWGVEAVVTTEWVWARCVRDGAIELDGCTADTAYLEGGFLEWEEGVCR